MIKLKTLSLVFILGILSSCQDKPTEHTLKVTDSIIYYDSLTLINESP